MRQFLFIAISLQLLFSTYSTPLVYAQITDTISNEQQQANAQVHVCESETTPAAKAACYEQGYTNRLNENCEIIEDLQAKKECLDRQALFTNKNPEDKGFTGQNFRQSIAYTTTIMTAAFLFRNSKEFKGDCEDHVQNNPQNIIKECVNSKEPKLLDDIAELEKKIAELEMNNGTDYQDNLLSIEKGKLSTKMKYISVWCH
jgi:hypothetical protein